MISDRITAWGLADEPELRQFVSRVTDSAPARLHGANARPGVASYRDG